ncbi:UNVERIFIED_CONTAM: hypothetical protein FKN15_060022 [Acipenser sinensis]
MQAQVSTPRSHSPSPQARQVKRSKQARDIMDLKAQMAQVLELLTRQQAPASPAAAPAPPSPAVLYRPSPRGDQSEREASSHMAAEDELSIAASRGESSFPTEMEEGGEPELFAEAELSSKVVSEASVPPLSSSMSALMGRTATFLQVPWTTAAEPHRPMFQTQAVALRPQPFPAFPDFMEEILGNLLTPMYHGRGNVLTVECLECRTTNYGTVCLGT